MSLAPFDYQPRTRLIYGNGTLARVGELARDLGGETAKHLVGGIHDEPVARDGGWGGGKRFHDCARSKRAAMLERPGGRVNVQPLPIHLF